MSISAKKTGENSYKLTINGVDKGSSLTLQEALAIIAQFEKEEAYGNNSDK